VGSVVHGYVLQDAFFEVTANERRRIRRAFGGAPLEADHGDRSDTTPEQRAGIARSLVETTLSLRCANALAAGEADRGHPRRSDVRDFSVRATVTETAGSPRMTTAVGDYNTDLLDASPGTRRAWCSRSVSTTSSP
jgi:hypothetical protein